MFQVGDFVNTRHGSAQISSLTTDGKQAYFNQFSCYQDLIDISLFQDFKEGSWIFARNKRTGKNYQPFQYFEGAVLNSIYDMILWIPIENENVWITEYKIPVKIDTILGDDFFVSNSGIGFEKQCYLKDLAPFVGEFPSFLNL